MSTQSNADLVALAGRVMFQNNKPAPIVLHRGLGAELWDVDGKRYLDMTAGIAVCALGHGHPAFAARLAEQVGRLTQTSNLFYNDQQILAAEAITARSFADRVFFCSSGAEANEAALKLARRYQQVVANAPQRITIVATEGSFHGRTFATVAVTGQAKYRDGFGPLLEPIERVPFGNLEAARAVLERGTACAFLVEPIQAEGGIVVPPPGYLQGLRELCDATGTLLIFDEVQTGMGRTGAWFGHQVDGVVPDVMTLAKGLGGGIPVGAIAASEKAAAGLAMLPGGVVPHATTYGGNALACAATRAVFDIIERDGLLANVAARGEHLAKRLGELVARYPGHAVEVRGRGLLRGLAVSGAPAQVVLRARELGTLFSVAGDKVVRFAPAFIVTDAQLDEAVDVLAAVLAEGVGKAAA